MTQLPLLCIVGLFGLILGSFLNVCIVRWPADQSVVRPRSRCPRCERPIAWYDNVPILSWLILRGKCRSCGESIPVLYPLVEATSGVVWVGAVILYGMTLTGLTAGVFGTILLGIGVTDGRTYLIPDEYTLGGLGLGLLLSWRNGWPGFLDSVLGAAVGFGLLYVIAVAGERIFKKEAMGGGDIKMMAMVGAFLGWQGVPLTIFGGALLGTVVFLPLQGVRAVLARRRGTEATELLVPFGVFLAAAAGLAFVFGNWVVAWYAGYIAAG